MPRHEETYFLKKKAYEISYAAFMIAAAVKNQGLRDSLEKEAVLLIDGVSGGFYEKSRSVLESLEYLLRFGADVGIVHPDNSELVVREINVLSSAIAESERTIGVERLSSVNLRDIFSEKITRKQERQAEAVKTELPRQNTANIPTAGRIHAESTALNQGHSALNSAIRQSSILDKIRQSGNCRLKDIQESLPNTSERTIRYDIQALIEQGLVERIGNGGPATYYRVRERLAPAVSEA